MKYLPIILLLLLSSCKSYYLNKYCHPDDFMTVRDSIVLHDSTVLKIKDSTRIEIVKGGSVETQFNPCDSAGLMKVFEQKFKNGSNTTIIKSDGKNLFIKSDCEDKINEYRAQIQSLVNDAQTFKSNVVHEVKYIEKPLTWWQRIKIGWIGDLTFILSSIFALYITYKLKFK